MVCATGGNLQLFSNWHLQIVAIPTFSASGTMRETRDIAEGLPAGTNGDGPSSQPAEPVGEGASQNITEEEAALYDRQLRLWGAVAQSRIRQCRAVISPFQGGVAIETAKNLILAGVNELILVDDGLVEEGSLAAGFVWREEDIGRKRIEAALPRLSSLNPHVKITPILEPPSLQSLVQTLDSTTDSTPIAALIYTNSNPFSPTSINTSIGLAQLNEECRLRRVKFHLAQAQGLDGFIFQDLGTDHQFLVEKKKTTRDEKNATVETTWTELQQQDFVTFGEAVSPTAGVQPWKGKSVAATRRALKGSELFWATLAVWDLAYSGTMSDPSSLQDDDGSLLSDRIVQLIQDYGGPSDVTAVWRSLEIQGDPKDWAKNHLRTTLPAASSTQPADFAPTTAVLGGILAQEVLNAVGGREAPKVANWMNWYGLRGQAPVFALGGLQSVKAAAAADVVAAGVP
ncbi:unnamed protein product [Parajaminaea phylloscopi]